MALEQPCPGRAAHRIEHQSGIIEERSAFRHSAALWHVRRRRFNSDRINAMRAAGCIGRPQSAELLKRISNYPALVDQAFREIKGPGFGLGLRFVDLLHNHLVTVGFASARLDRDNWLPSPLRRFADASLHHSSSVNLPPAPRPDRRCICRFRRHHIDMNS